MSAQAKGTLYLVPCPIGDTEPGDVLPARNLEIMRTLDYFIVEDMRSARRFLSRARIGRPVDTLEMAELNEHTQAGELGVLLRPLLEGRSAGVISEAGVPGIADPGSAIVMLCHDNGVRVVPLVGPSSIVLAMMASGLNGQSFAFNGYLPVKPAERVRAIRDFERRARAANQAQAFIETPYRNTALFGELVRTCDPATMLTVAADLTSPREFILTATVARWRSLPAPEIHKRPAIFIIQ